MDAKELKKRIIEIVTKTNDYNMLRRIYLILVAIFGAGQ